ncbi:MAG: HlyD family efflux transporter periplasmic adaptor subunit [Candidatus Rifleibacteriota bacterium]
MKKILLLILVVLFSAGCQQEISESKKAVQAGGKDFFTRAEFASMEENLIFSPFTTEIVEMVPEGTLVKPGQKLAQLSPGGRVENLHEESANLEKLSLQMNLEQMKKQNAGEIEQLKKEQVRLEMQKAKIELERALSVRDWQRIAELEQSIKLDELKLELAGKQLNAAEKMIGRGFVARQELLETEKDLAINRINASLTVKLADYLDNNADEKEVEKSRQAYENKVLDYELAEFNLNKTLAEHEYQYKLIKSNYDELVEEVNKVENEIASLSIGAPANGLVLYGNSYDGSAFIKVQPGVMVYPGINFLRIVDPAQGGIIFKADPKDYARFSSAKVLFFRPDAFPEIILPCRLSKISRLAFASQDGRPDGRTFVEVKAEIASYPEILKIGYSGTVLFNNSKERFMPQFNGNRIHRVEKRDVARRTSNTGDVKPASFSYVLSAFDGEVNSLAQEGQSVEKGDVIAVIASEELDEEARDLEIELQKKREELLLMKEKHQIDDARLKRQLEVKSGALEVARMRHAALLKRRDEDKIIDLEKNLEVIQARIDLAREKVAHVKELHKKGLRSELQMLQAQQELAAAIKDKKLTSYQLKVEKSGPSNRTIKISEIDTKKVALEKKIVQKEASQTGFINSMSRKILEKEISKLEINLARKTKELSKARIKAPGGGVVIYSETHSGGEKAKIKVGDKVNPRIPFMQIAGMNNLQIHTEISEMDAKFIEAGDEVKVYLKGNSVSVARGWVSSISIIADTNFTKSQDANVKIIIDLLSPENGVTKVPEGFRPGISCEVEFTLYDLKDALIIPFDAVIPMTDGPAVVNKDKKLKPVKVAFSDGLEGYVIESGIKEGEEILLMEAGID